MGTGRTECVVVLGAARSIFEAAEGDDLGVDVAAQAKHGRET